MLFHQHKIIAESNASNYWEHVSSYNSLIISLYLRDFVYSDLQVDLQTMEHGNTKYNQYHQTKFKTKSALFICYLRLLTKCAMKLHINLKEALHLNNANSKFLLY